MEMYDIKGRALNLTENYSNIQIMRSEKVGRNITKIIVN